MTKCWSSFARTSLTQIIFKLQVVHELSCLPESAAFFCPAGKSDDPGVHGQRVLLTWRASPGNSSHSWGKITLMEAKESRIISDVKLTAQQSKGQIFGEDNEPAIYLSYTIVSLELNKSSVVSCTMMRSCSAFKYFCSLCTSGCFKLRMEHLETQCAQITWLVSVCSNTVYENVLPACKMCHFFPHQWDWDFWSITNLRESN